MVTWWLCRCCSIRYSCGAVALLAPFLAVPVMMWLASIDRAWGSSKLASLVEVLLTVVG